MIRHATLFCLGMAMGLFAWAQPRIGFTNPTGFPTVISNTGGHNLDGYIKNTGQDTLFGNVNIRMRVNGGPAIPIQNNVSLGSALAPGDSVYWTKNGHIFPPGQFAPGNNDVLIWPTRAIWSQDSIEIDTIKTSIFYSEASAFMLCDAPIPVLADGIDVLKRYNISACATNAGVKGSNKTVALYMQVGTLSPKVITISNEIVLPGEEVELKLDNFKIRNFITEAEVPQEELLTLEAIFWVAEIDLDNGINEARYRIVDTSTPSPTPTPLPTMGEQLVYPNPVQEVCHLNLPVSIEAETTETKVYNAAGQVVQQVSGMVEWDVRELPSGTYFLQVISGEKRITARFFKE